MDPNDPIARLARQIDATRKAERPLADASELEVLRRRALRERSHGQGQCTEGCESRESFHDVS